MANPVLVTCLKEVWTKVVTGQTAGVIHVLKDEAKYLQTYRDAGGIAPTTVEEGARFDTQLNISASAAIDVYVWCQVQDGKVRVDL